MYNALLQWYAFQKKFRQEIARLTIFKGNKGQFTTTMGPEANLRWRFHSLFIWLFRLNLQSSNLIVINNYSWQKHDYNNYKNILFIKLLCSCRMRFCYKKTLTRVFSKSLLKSEQSSLSQTEKPKITMITSALMSRSGYKFSMPKKNCFKSCAVSQF